MRAVPPLPGRAAGAVRPHRSAWGSGRDGAFAEYVVLPMTNVWHHWAGIDLDVAAIFDPLGNAVHTALAFPVLGEDVLVSGAGPIGLMATAVARHAGARHVVVSEPNAFRRELALRMGATAGHRPGRDARSTTSSASLAMVEGYDVALEMSGNPDALRSAIAAMAHGGGIAVLGLPTARRAPSTSARSSCKMLTIRGIYGREMYETWYKMTVMLRLGARHQARPSPTASTSATTRPPSPPPARGDSGKVIMNWAT